MLGAHENSVLFKAQVLTPTAQCMTNERKNVEKVARSTAFQLRGPAGCAFQFNHPVFWLYLT